MAISREAIRLFKQFLIVIRNFILRLPFHRPLLYKCIEPGPLLRMAVFLLWFPPIFHLALKSSYLDYIVEAGSQLHILGHMTHQKDDRCC